MNRSDYEAQWFCSVCGGEFPVPTLARDHEADHAEKAERDDLTHEREAD